MGSGRRSRGRAPASPARDGGGADTNAARRGARSDGRQASPLVVRAPPSAADELPSEWFYADASNTQHGPLSVEELRALNDSALGLPPDALFCSPGMSEWLPLDQLPALCAAVTAPRPSPLSRFFVQEAWVSSEATEQASPNPRTPRGPNSAATGRRCEAARRGGDPPARRRRLARRRRRWSRGWQCRDRHAPHVAAAVYIRHTADGGLPQRGASATAGPTRLPTAAACARRPRVARPADERVRARGRTTSRG